MSQSPRTQPALRAPIRRATRSWRTRSARRIRDLRRFTARHAYGPWRADRLAASIGTDVYAWWLYPDEAFDNKHAAARALIDILDPAGRRQKPIHTMLVLEQELGAALARLQPTR